MGRKSVALIGIGRWGKNLARNLDSLGVLHSICDINEQSLDLYQESYPNVNLTSNYRSLLENPEIKQVMIAAPAFQHYPLAKQALLAGKDVYVEKPLCMDCQQGNELVKLAEEKKRILMVGHLLQYHPCVRSLQELIGSGELGQLQYIVSNRLNLGAYRTEENALWNFAPHDLSVILSLCGHQLPEKVRCSGAAYLSKGVADTTLTLLKFAGDLRAHIYVSWLNPYKEQKLIVVGSSGMIVFDDTQDWDKKLALYRDHVVWEGGNRPIVNRNEVEWVEVSKDEPLKEECLHFLKCCEERIIPRTDGAEGLRVLQVLEAAQASLNSDGEAIHLSQNIPETHALASNYFAHPTAVIDPGAEIEAQTKIWHFSHVMAGAKIGQRCNIGQNVVVSKDVVLGTNVKVQNNVSLYSGVICEDDVFLGPSMVFTNIQNPRSAVVRRDQYQKTIVRKGASIGANATILCGIELGEHCFIGAGAIVTKDVKPYALMVGNPARQVGWMSQYGSRLELPLESPKGEILTAKCPDTGEEYQLVGDQLEMVQPALQLS